MKAYALILNYGSGDRLLRVTKTSDVAEQYKKEAMESYFKSEDLDVKEIEVKNPFVYVVSYNYGNGDVLISICDTEQEAQEYVEKHQEDYMDELDIEKMNIVQ